MTRINVIPVYELSDQHLLAEYRELPRVIKQNLDLTDTNIRYHLGRGHMKWARRHWKFALNRYYELFTEMIYRGFSPKYSPAELEQYVVELSEEWPYADYIVDKTDIALNRDRIRSRYLAHPDHYKWTRRTKPEWIEGGNDAW